MMSHLDILVLLVVVLLIFQKLRSILGTNHEERQIHLSKESAEKLYDILAKENGKQYTPPAEMCSPETAAEELVPQTDETELSDTDKALAKIPGFNKDKFTNNARNAFQIVTQAFNNGDVETLEMLVSKPILDKFQDVIDKRKADGITAETDFICFDKVNIIKAEITENETAKISVEFVSEQVNVLRDKDGKVLEGDENYIQNITDVWTFERALNSTSPNWILISTKKQ